MRLLIIEDEERLSGILKSWLGGAGFTVDVAGSATGANAAVELINYDAVVLDLGLPDGDGLAVLAAARRTGKALPILILTARDAVEDRVAGLDAGADDYLTKPFAMSELIARIKAPVAPSRRRSRNHAPGRQSQPRYHRAGAVGRRNPGVDIPPGAGNARADDATVRTHRSKGRPRGETLRDR